jgi:uncharacterized protein involved in exopolysaccharide biosynthesis
MELRDFTQIWKKNSKLFWMIVLIITLATIIWQRNQPESFRATLLLNIGRTGTQSTGDYYTYDGFYRLQADERFADTVVRWLGSPRVVEDIYTAAGMDKKSANTSQLKSIFGAKRLSSQMIEVTYSDRDEKVLQKISVATIGTLNRYTQNLNEEKNDLSWFMVIGSDPVIRNARISFPLALLVGLLCGVFVGFWTVLIKHYFSRD